MYLEDLELNEIDYMCFIYLELRRLFIGVWKN